jgi:transposase
MRATYRRLQGTEHFLGFYDVHRDCLDGIFSPRKRIEDLVPAFVRLRRCYPNQRLYVILDNLHLTHDHPRFLQLLERLGIIPVFTPTQASWLNLIEAHFGVLRRFTLTDTDDPSHLARRRRIYRYLRWRHRQAGTTDHRLSRIRQMPISHNKLKRH